MMATEPTAATTSSHALENELLSFSNPNYQLGDAVNCNTAGTTIAATTTTATTNATSDVEDPYDDLYQKLDSVCNFKQQQPSAVKNRRNYAALDINSMGIDLQNNDHLSAADTTSSADANSNTDLNSMTMTSTHRNNHACTDNADRSGSGFFNYLICADGAADWTNQHNQQHQLGPDLLEDARLRRSSIDSIDGHLAALKLPLTDGSPGEYSNGNDGGSSSCMELNSPDDEGSVMCGSVTVESAATSDDVEIPHVPGQLNDDLYAVLVKRRVGCKPTTPAEDAKDEDTSLLVGPLLEPLPPGWERHEDNDGPYYWHIKSGTIQRQVPQPLATPSSADAKPVAAATMQLDKNETNVGGGGLLSGPVAIMPDTMCISTAHVVSLPQIDNKDKRKSYPRAEHDNKDKPIRFAVRSLGWVEIAEEDLTPERSSKAVNKCIVDLSLGRNDILDVVGRWGDGKDLFMDLDNTSLKLIDPENLTVLNTQPIHTIRVWGVGRDNGRDFAYVARDRSSRKHMCHVFRCDTPARTIANTLRDICKRIMIERSQVMTSVVMGGGGRSMADQAQQTRTSTQLTTSMSSSSSLCSASVACAGSNSGGPSSSSTAASRAASGVGVAGGLVRPTNLPTEQRRFQSRGTVTTYSAQSFPTPMEEPKKVLKVHYLGMTRVNKPTGMDVLNAAVEQMTATVPMDKWHFVNVAIAPSTITISEPGEEGKQLVECRVRFLSFLGIGRNVKHCGFIMHTAQDEFVAHIFHCEPSSGALCKTIEAACKLRYQKCLDAHPAGSDKRLSDSQNVRGLGATIKNVLGTLSGKRSKSTDS